MTGLILVDLQNDFMPDGALEVKNGNEILPVINELLKMPFDVIVASMDWHPQDHVSFAIWPDHCVQGTSGAEFHSGWDSSKVHAVFKKGKELDEDSYSAFHGTDLEDYLKKRAIHTVYVAGLATDYCVKHSVIDALNLGFKVNVVLDGCKGVNLQPDDSKNAIEEMKQAGARVLFLKEIHD